MNGLQLSSLLTMGRMVEMGRNTSQLKREEYLQEVWLPLTTCCTLFYHSLLKRFEQDSKKKKL